MIAEFRVKFQVLYTKLSIAKIYFKLAADKRGFRGSAFIDLISEIRAYPRLKTKTAKIPSARFEETENSFNL